MNIGYPYRFDSTGRTAQAEYARHVEDMIEQFLFTRQGERVMLPEFGSGLMQMIFAPNTPEVAAALQASVQGGLQRWLADVIDVRDLSVASDDAVLRVRIVYSLHRSGETRTRVFERSLV